MDFYSLFCWTLEENEKSARAAWDAAFAEASAAAAAASILIDTPLRAPICSMLGHTGSGKTALLDSMRRKPVPSPSPPPPANATLTNAATYFKLKPDHPSIRLPGLLFIDTPGQPLLTYLKSQAVTLSDIVILVLDINNNIDDFHPQTIESLTLLQSWNKKFIVALNHIDKISGWKTFPNASFRQSYHKQSSHAQKQFSSCFTRIIAEFKRHRIKADLYLNNKELGETVSIVPTSAISGEGLSDIKSELIKLAQKTMVYTLRYRDELQCTVLDVKVLEGRGTIINVVLVNGVLHVGDQIAVSGPKGHILTSIQALWTALPHTQLDAKSHYVCHKEIKGVKAVKIIAQGLEHAIAGTDLHVVKTGDDSKDIIGREQDSKDDLKDKILEPLLEVIDSPLRAPICSMLGDLGSGKTALLDCMRRKVVPSPPPANATLTNAATHFILTPDHPSIRLPGVLFIDTPGQQLLTHLKSQAVALCDIAILVVDINIDNFQPQTIESLTLLQTWNKKFIVALNRIDQISGWKTFRNAPFRQSYDQQSSHAQKKFSSSFRKIIAEFKQRGIKADMYLNNKELGETVSIVPTSAISGEGLIDIKSELIIWTQKTMVHRLTYRDELQCTVLDVRVVEGRGTTINVVLVNGVLHVGDQIAVCGTQGQIVTSIQALWTALPHKELDAKAHYERHKEIKGVKAVKIIAQGLEHAIAGTDLHVVKPCDDSKDIIGHEQDSKDDSKKKIPRGITGGCES